MIAGRGRKVRPPRRVCKVRTREVKELHSPLSQHTLVLILWHTTATQFMLTLPVPLTSHCFLTIMLTMKAKIILPQGLGTSDAVDFDSMWDVLASSLREIHTKNASKLSFEELYRNAYKLVLKKRGETLYIRVKEFEEEWLANEVQPRIIEELSQTLLLATAGNQTIATANEKRVAGEKLLRALKQAWEDHNLCMNMTTDVLMYMVGNS